MLKGNNDQQLIQRGVHEEVISFYQIWQELVHEKTLDVYQYRVLTSLSALKELTEVLRKTINGLFNSDANIEACREEILSILECDKIMKRHYKAVLNRLQFSLGNKPKSEADKNRLMQQLEYMIREVEPYYLRFALDDLKESIGEKNIEEMEFYANVVASQAVYNGWASKALFDLLRFFDSNKPFDEQWKEFSSVLLNRERTRYDVLINVPFKQQKAEEQLQTIAVLGKIGLEVKTYEELVIQFSDIQDMGSLLKKEKRYFCISVEAFDIYMAAHIAIRSISEQLNLASFYNLVSAWDLSAVVILPVNSVSKYHKAITAGKLYQTYDYIDSSSKIFEYTRWIFKNEQMKNVREKFQGAFSYANISRASLFQEEKYMNLWVSLESLARTNMYADIITNVKNTVPAAMSLRYVYRIVRNYIEDCARCGVEFNFPNHCIDMKQDTKQQMVRETIEVFQDRELYTQLLDKCKINMLLKYRTESIYLLLNDISVVKKKVENHYNKIRWQIQRLYRIRNEIAHAALQEKNSLIVYIEHLYDYLSVYISEIVTCLVENRQTSIEEALCSIRDNYDVFLSFVQEKEDFILKRTVLKTGIINLITDKYSEN